MSNTKLEVMLGGAGIALIFGALGIWRSYDYITSSFVALIRAVLHETIVPPPLDMWYIVVVILLGIGMIVGAIYSAKN